MKKLLTFETFVPKNIVKREIEFAKIQEKKFGEFNEFVKHFQISLDKIQGLTIADEECQIKQQNQEQLFINLMQGLKIKIDNTNRPFEIQLLNNRGKYVFSYVFNTCEMICQYDNVWALLDMSDKECVEFITDMSEKYFKIDVFDVIYLFNSHR